MSRLDTLTDNDLTPLFEFWGTVCDVFETWPALSKANQHRTLGRLWEAYKVCRGEMDADFDPGQFPRVPNHDRIDPRLVTECPDCGETGRRDGRVLVDGRGVYSCSNDHHWQDAEETPSNKGVRFS